MIKNVTILLPSKNHENDIFENFNSLDEFCSKNIENYEILIVSNGSNLKNIKVLDSIKGHENVSHEVLSNSGKGLAVKHGLEQAKYNNILIYDADFSYKIEMFLDFFDNKSEPIAPFMYLERTLSKEILKNTSFLRVVSGVSFNYLVQKILKIKSKDTQAGFKFVNKKDFKNCLDFQSKDFDYDLELFLLANKSKIKTHSVKVFEIIESDHTNVGIISDSIKMFIKLFNLRNNYL